MTDTKTDPFDDARMMERALALLRKRAADGIATPPERVAAAVLAQGDNGVEEKHGPMVLGPAAADELRPMIVAVVSVACDVLDRADQPKMNAWSVLES